MKEFLVMLSVAAFLLGLGATLFAMFWIGIHRGDFHDE